jgi:hypothetical protein
MKLISSDLVPFLVHVHIFGFQAHVILWEIAIIFIFSYETQQIVLQITRNLISINLISLPDALLIEVLQEVASDAVVDVDGMVFDLLGSVDLQQVLLVQGHLCNESWST